MSTQADVVETTRALLRARPPRQPDFEAESHALRRLAAEMAVSPDGVLCALCEQILDVCGAESAGVSLLAAPHDDADFVWPAIAGLWASYTGGGMPRHASPCGEVLRLDRSLLFHDVELDFPAVLAASPRIDEILLAPFRVDGRPIGTVWAIMHSNARRFDDEDRRLLESLAQFAAAAYQMKSAEQAAQNARAQIDLANHELAHRLKNMLAMVSAVAGQTLKHVTERDAVRTFERRISSLGAAHDVLVDQSWVAAPLRSIAERVIAVLGESNRVILTGPDVAMGPRAALALAMILHELATNAVKYGAFSNTEGRILLSWDITDGEEPQLEMSWREEGGPVVQPPTGKGFGSRLIAAGLAGEGSVDIDYNPAGLHVVFRAPLQIVQEAG